MNTVMNISMRSVSRVKISLDTSSYLLRFREIPDKSMAVEVKTVYFYTVLTDTVC